MAKINEKILKAAREKQLVIYKWSPTRLSTDFSAETLQARNEWHKYIQNNEKKKSLQPRMLHPAKLSIRIEGGIKSIKDKKMLRVHHH